MTLSVLVSGPGLNRGPSAFAEAMADDKVNSYFCSSFRLLKSSFVQLLTLIEPGGPRKSPGFFIS